MTKLDYTLKTDTLFKLMFVKYPGLLKNLVSHLLGIPLESIGQFEITNSEVPPDTMKDKFCCLDINMIVDGQQVDLEIQVRNEGDYPERVLYYWAREYSSALPEGGDFIFLPRTIVISIIDFNLFNCREYHSEFKMLEATRHTILSDKISLQFFELKKLPNKLNTKNLLLLWLSLFKANTKEEIDKIKILEVPIMNEAIEAFYHVKALPEFQQLERMRSDARHNEAAALRHAREQEREKWQKVIAEKDAENAKKLAEKEAENAKLRAQLEKLGS